MTEKLSSQSVDQFRLHYQSLESEISKCIVGYKDVIDQVLTAMMSGGHVLVEGVPGLGKT